MKLSAFSFGLSQGVAHITLNRPDIGNPMNADFCREFNQLSIECSGNPAVRAVLIDATGDYFCVGGDLKTFTADRGMIPRLFRAWTADLHMGVSRFSRMDAPVVVATHSLVVGGGVAIAAAADFVLASSDSKFYAAFAAIGLCGDTGISYFLPRRAGSRKATEFLIGNQKWSADEALRNGLVNLVVERDQLPASAMTFARELAAGPTGTYGKMKRLLLSSYDQPLEAQLELEARAMVECAHTEDAWNAMNAVANKEKPRFENR